MNLRATFSIATIALMRNKMRSSLTVLGIVIGIAAVVATVSIGTGAKESVGKIFEAMGTNMLTVRSNATRTAGIMGAAGSGTTLTWDDLQAIDEEASAVVAIAPVMETRTQVASEEQNWNTQITGTTPSYFKIRNWKIKSGAFFDEDANAAGAKVALIGTTVAKELYGTSNPIGQPLRISGQVFEIVGVLASKGNTPWGSDYDDTVIIPAKTFTAKLQSSLGRYLKGNIIVSAASEADTTRAETQITTILRDRHKISAQDEDDFSIRNMAEFAKAQKESTNTITTLLSAVAAVSLLVGGIGVMNIMLVSVIERTREIGIRMAVGATPSNVLAQFLTEAIVLSVIGGVVGLFVGWFASLQMAKNLSLIHI